MTPGTGAGEGAGEDFARDLHTAHRHLSIGPAHPTGHGSVRWIAELDGETVVGLETELGYAHRGFEKECEDHTWYQIVPYTERLNFEASILSATAFCSAVEQLLGLDVPPHAQWLRVLAGELSRCAHHLGRLAALARSISAETAGHYAIDARERIWDAIEALSGARVTSGFVRIGGVARRAPDDFADRWRVAGPRVGDALRDLDGLLGRNRFVVERLRGTGVLDAEACLAWSVTGPVARAAGVERDLRKEDPGPVYAELDFDVPIGRHGDNLDRFLVYMEEIRQSLRIVDQCVSRLEALGPEAIQSDDRRIAWPERSAAPDAPEDIVQQFMAVTEGPLVPAGETYRAVESANGELGFYIVSDGTSRPVKVRCRPPSFFHLQALEPMLRGAPLADLMPTFELLGVVAGECDR